MIVTNQTKVEDIMVRARAVELKCNARANLFTPLQAAFVLEYLPTAQALAQKTGKVVRVWNCEAKPTEYRWSGWRYLQWTLQVDPDGFSTLAFKRVKGPANSRSFNGIRFEVKGVKDRSILWRAGRQYQRVLRWEPDIIKAARVVGAASLLLAALIFLT